MWLLFVLDLGAIWNIAKREVNLSQPFVFHVCRYPLPMWIKEEQKKTFLSLLLWKSTQHKTDNRQLLESLISFSIKSSRKFDPFWSKTKNVKTNFLPFPSLSSYSYGNHFVFHISFTLVSLFLLLLYVSLPLSIHPSIYPYIYLSISSSLYPSIPTSIYPSINLSIYLSISTSLYPYI